MDLLERDGARAVVDTALGEAVAGEGRVVVVTGEAGVGKSALLAAVLRAREATHRVLVGACDPLLTPRALGPFHDIARQAGEPLVAAAREPVRREELVTALLSELGGTPPRVLVIEDAHWADEGTLDLLAVIGRRIGTTTGTLVVTLRPDQADDRLRAALGEMPSGAVRRIELGPLGPASVAELARRAGREPGDLHDTTGGNPFYVTEVLASGHDETPGSVRDAVLARARRLGDTARRVLEIVAVVPGRAETWLVGAVLAGDPAGPIDECLAIGMLELDGMWLRFRHEIARSSVEEELTPMRRRQLAADVLAALAAHPGTDPARLVHHARQAGDRAAILTAAPAAARRAAQAGAHIEAAAHYRSALEAADDLEPSDLADLLEGLSYEAYLSGSPQEALDARRRGLAIRVRLGQAAEAGEDERWLSRLFWWIGRRAESEAAAARSISLLEPLGPTSGLAMAYSTLSQLLMLAWRTEGAVEWGRRAIAMSRDLGDRSTLSHALNNVGTALMESGDDEGAAMLEEAAALACADGEPDHAVRAMVNLTWGLLSRRRYAESTDVLERGLAFARANDLRAYDQYLLGMRAWQRLDTGDWAGAEEDGRAVMAIDAARPTISAHPGMIRLGLLLARRGDPGGRELLEDAWRRATAADEPQRLAPSACALAELAWLDDDPSAVRAHGAAALAALAGTPGRMAGEAGFWSWRGGGDAGDISGFEPGFRLAIAGDPRGAAAAWEEAGCPYAAADALWESDDDDDLLRALAIFDRLGATVPAARVRRRLRRGGGVVPAGPRPATRSDPDGLTPRQREILDMVAGGMTNTAIAARLVLSTRTVDHHVSAILRALGVSTRAEAAARAGAVGHGDAPVGDGQGPGPM